MTTKKRGTRLIYHATAGTSWTNQAAGAAIPSGWVQVVNLIDVDVVPHEPNTYDDSDLEDTSEEMITELKPGSLTFTKKKNSQTATLRSLADAQTKYAWALLYPDGTAEYIASGSLICTSGGRADTGGFNEKSPESWRVVADDPSVHKPTAS